jgi:L-fuculose-phosphate aldolase
MIHTDEHDDLAEVCRLLYERGYVTGVEGNLSIRMTDNTILTTPASTCKGKLRASDMVYVNLETGATINGGKASTELALHTIAYRKRPDVMAVVHAHPTTAIALTVAGLGLEKCILPEVVCTVGTIPTAPYSTPSTDEVPKSIEKLVENHDAILLDHHGAVALGKTIWDAFYKMELIESCAKIMMNAHLLGGPKPLKRSQVARLLDIRGVYGFANPLATEKILSPACSEPDA